MATVSPEELREYAGRTLSPSSWKTVTQDLIDGFADVTDDHQFIHVDLEKASRGPFGTTIAHGFLTLSLLPGLTKAVQGSSSQYEGVKLGVNYGLNRVRFPAPVKADSRVRARSKLKEVTEVEGGLQLIREIAIEVEGQEKPACVAESISRLYF